MITCKLPFGEPRLKKDGFPNVPSYEFPFRGVGHITIAPPPKIEYPVLGTEVHNIFTFPRCYNCAAALLTDNSCCHTQKERSIKGVWSHFEIRKALEMNYVILAYHKVWMWDEFSTDLYKEYALLFLTVMIKKRGYSSVANGEEIEKEAVARYAQMIGFDIPKDRNPAFIGMAARILLDPREYVTNKKPIICNPAQLSEYFNNQKDRMDGYWKVTNDIYIVSLKQAAEDRKEVADVFLLDIMLIGLARLRLYSLADKNIYQNDYYTHHFLDLYLYGYGR